MINLNKLSLYIHIPFCVRKCDYCDFLSAPSDETTREIYIQALLMEIEEYRNTALSKREILSVFIGGGTPSLLKEEQIVKLLDKINDVFLLGPECEVTIEANPGSVTKEKCMCYLMNGINRISIGLQSPDDKLLKILGRIHTYEEFLRTYADVREAGFKNVNIDLMASLPGQTVDGYCEGLKHVAALSPEHISAYSLILEEGTPFYDKYVIGEEDFSKQQLFHGRTEHLPDESADRLMYERTKMILGEFGYDRYEISNYAKAGYECKHNIVYWKRGDYLGLGLGSSSLVERFRYKNVSDLKTYVTLCNQKAVGKIYEEKEELTIQAQMEEFMFLGLRMTQGVSNKEFYKMFGYNIEDIYRKQIEKLQKQGLLNVSCDGGRSADITLWLTDLGLDVSNYVFEHFLL